MINTEIKGSWKVTIYSQEFNKKYEFEYVDVTRKHIFEAILVGLFPKKELESAIFTDLTPERIAELEAEQDAVWDRL
jgi:hypothetical protein